VGHKGSGVPLNFPVTSTLISASRSARCFQVSADRFINISSRAGGNATGLSFLEDQLPAVGPLHCYEANATTKIWVELSTLS